MLVPLYVAYPDPLIQDLTPTPGPETFGFSRLEPSTVTAPLLLNPAIPSLLFVAPTVKLPLYMAAGVFIVPQLDPELPAETTTTQPAARRLLIAVSRILKFDGSQPSEVGQPQELLITCGIKFGLAAAGLP